ncbi:MAG TPA: hypothetical protein VGY55_07215 [Pirellulales bacterium]|jgi:hypothetical protein|nr:hypothetical protein [Pirellulales bacterium]
MPKRKKKPTGVPATPVESQAAEAATIGWMLSVLTATVCESGVLAARLYFAWHPNAAAVGTAGELLLFSSAITGLVALLLIPVVYRTRLIRPPSTVTAFAVIVGIIPWLVLSSQLLK